MTSRLHPHETPRPARWTRHSGIALVTSLLLLLVVSLLGISTVATAVLEQQMAGNLLRSARAFEAAEAGVTQAMAAASVASDPLADVGDFDHGLPQEPAPIRGHGAPIDGCADDGPDPDGRCEYFLRLDAGTGITPVPGGSADPTRRACHFVVESFGVAARGARAEITASFFLIGPEDCSGQLSDPPVLTYWRQRGVD